MAIWGAERLWQRAIGRVSMDGLLWKPNLYYTPEHTWITWQDLALRVGLDDLAQRVLFGAQAIKLPRPGEEVREGQTVTVVQCGNKWAEIASPVDGVIAAVNEAVREDPSVIHRDPYDHGWLYAVIPKNFRYTCLPQGKPARNWFRDEGVRLTRFLKHNLGVAAADGGELLFPAPSLLSEEQWDALTKSFLRPPRPIEIAATAGDGRLDGEPGEGNGRFPPALTPFVAIFGAIAGGLHRASVFFSDVEHPQSGGNGASQGKSPP
jgi:glycine cleavage system H lipoate-binding protein